MPTDVINFRQDLQPLQGITLEYKISEDGWLLDGYAAFPPGCNGLVDVRIRIEIDGAIQQTIPIAEEFLALDDAVIHFLIDRKVSAGDHVYVDMNNYDGANPHEINCPITWSNIRRMLAIRVKK